jgi:hypothetical protein
LPNIAQISPTADTTWELGENFTAFAGIGFSVRFTWGLGEHKIISPMIPRLSGDTMIF